LTGEFRVKRATLKPCKAKAVEILKKFESWTATHVLRHLNEEADMVGREFGRGKRHEQ